MSNFKVLGAMPPEQAAPILRELGELEAAEQLDVLTRSGAIAELWPFTDRPWQYTEHAFGFIAPQSGQEEQTIAFAGGMSGDESLRDTQIKITLNKLRVADYPGGGEHHLLFEFAGRNQVSDQAHPESATYTVMLRALEGQSAAVVGLPVFVGLNVGSEGVAFHCQVVNVKNSDDERMLSFMDSSEFKGGLQLMKTMQPALAPFAQMASGLTQALLKRNRNVKVQEFHLGLDFSNVAMGARLAEGAYVVVQIPDNWKATWSWKDWVYLPQSGNIVNATDKSALIPLNYLVLGVSRLRERTQ